MAAIRQHIGLNRIYVCAGLPLYKPGASAANRLMASFSFSKTVIELFPYINAVAEKSNFYKNPPLLRFIFKRRQCVLYPDHCIATPFLDRSEVGQFARALQQFIDDIADRKETIAPRNKVFRKASVTEIIKLLPLKNCGECGFKSCMAFAAAISQQWVTPGVCPYIDSPVEERASYPVYDSNGKLLKTVLLDIDTTKINEKLREKGRDQSKFNEQTVEDGDPRKMPGGRANETLPAPLTNRELEVLKNLANGETNIGIGKRLHISPHTVKSHVISIFNKLGVNDRTQASVWAARHNLL